MPGNGNGLQECTILARPTALTESTAIFIPFGRVSTKPGFHPHVEKPVVIKALKFKRKTELKLPIVKCLYSSFALKTNVTLSRRSSR